MLNPSDPTLGPSANSADIAQLMRGARAFGAVAFHDPGQLSPDQVFVARGYADCLPILGGGCWRDPASSVTQETMQ